MSDQNLPHVVIIGAGFAGLETARGLAKARVRITLIDRHNYHLFQPLLYQVAIAGLLPSQIAQPVRTIFRTQKNLTFRMGEVNAVNLAEKFVRLDGSIIAYDFLVVAVGGQNNFFGFDAIERNGFQVKDLETAIHTRNQLLSMFELASLEADAEKRRAMLTFVIVGGGATGVETAGALGELIEHVMIKDFPQLIKQEPRVILLEAAPELLGSYPEELRSAAASLLRGKNVDIRVNAKLADYNGQAVSLTDGSRIETQTVIWTAGVRAAALADGLGMKQVSGGRVRVESTLQLPGHGEAFLIGDAAFFVENDHPLPMVSTVAIQQGSMTAVNILRLIGGAAPLEFHYKDPGLLATVGRNAAVARIWGISFSGFAAWVIWVFLHIYRIIGFRNRILVMFNWMWDYFLYDNQSRLITRE